MITPSFVCLLDLPTLSHFLAHLINPFIYSLDRAMAEAPHNLAKNQFHGVLIHKIQQRRTQELPPRINIEFRVTSYFLVLCLI